MTIGSIAFAPLLLVNLSAMARGKDRAADSIARWSSRNLASDMPMPEAENGLALLWPSNDVLLVHAGAEIFLRADDLAIVDRSVPMRLEGNGVWTAKLLDFGPRSLALRTPRSGPFVAIALDGSDPLVIIISRFWRIGQEIERANLADELIVARLLDMIGEVVAKLMARGVSGGGVSNHRNAMVERAKLLIASHLTDTTFSPAMLAAKMRISRRHLSSLFAAVGTTATHAIQAQRLERAKALLAEPANFRRQIADIALSSGFADQSYFTRCFSKEYGQTPREFRNRHAI